jgi:hypothetical protein
MFVQQNDAFQSRRLGRQLGWKRIIFASDDMDAASGHYSAQTFAKPFAYTSGGFEGKAIAHCFLRDCARQWVL